MIKQNKINELFFKKGFILGFKIKKKDADILKNLIISKINKKLKSKKLNKKNFKKYHLIVKKDFHKKFFSNLKNRTFDLNDLRIFNKLSINNDLLKFFGKFKFHNLYQTRHKSAEINFRIVTPDEKKITPAHKDDWFYICNKIKKNKELYYIKCWIPLIFEKNKNGLSYVPGSLNKTYNFKILKRKNKTSIPIINSNYKLKKKNFNINQNQFIFFSNNLLHLSLIGGKFTRVSIEFELGVFKKNIQIK
jgi:hypothetical protein